MWSLGCVIAELFLGWPLYPGASEYDQVGPGSTGIRDSHSRLTWISSSFVTQHRGEVVGCHVVSQALFPFSLLSSLYPRFFSPFLFSTSSFPYNIVFFSKALEPLIYHMCGDREHPDLLLIFSCRFGIFHKHRVCQLNIY